MKHFLTSILIIIKLSVVPVYAQQDPGIQWIDQQVDSIWAYMFTNPDSSLTLAQTTMGKAEALGYQKGEADCANALGVLLLDKQAFAEAEKHFETALLIRTNLQDFNGQASVLHNMAGLLADQGRFPEAVKKAFLAINLWRKSGMNEQLGKAYNTLANIYSSNGDDDLAMAYYEKSLELLLQSEDYYAIADAQYNLAEQFRQLNALDKARTLFESALIIFRDSFLDTEAQADVYNALGNIALEQGNLALAEQYFYKSKHLYENLEAEVGLFDAFVNLGLLAETRKNYTKALGFYQKAQATLGPEASLVNRHYLAEQLVSVYENLGNYPEAFAYQKMAKTLNDSLFNETKQSQLAQLQVSYETEKLAKAHITQTLETHKRTFQRNLFMTISTGLFLLVAFGFFAFRQHKKANTLLMQQREWQHQREIGTLMKEQEYQLVKGRLAGQAEERRRIALEVNDGLASKIAAVNWQLEAIKESLGTELEPLDKIQTAVQDIFKDIDQVVQHLKANNPNGGGLEAALNKLKHIVEKECQIKTEIQFIGNTQSLEPQLEIAVYRILRELAGNVVKHAHATALTICLHQKQDQLHILVEDNGKGFNPDQIKLLGLGLKRIELLVQSLDGSLEIDSRPGAGTTIFADLPV